MSSIITLRGLPIDLDSAAGHQFVVDACRAGEGVITDSELCEKYEISPENLTAISRNKALIRAIQAERERRVRSGTAARESAAKIFVRAPQVLGDILDDKSASPRHRIESAKELRATANGPGAESAGEASERFVITINLGGDVETYSKSRTVNPNDRDPAEPLKIVVDNNDRRRELERDD
jgi:hypothetical protein